MFENNLKEVSLRVKYESFAKLSAEVTASVNLEELALALRTNLKYIFDYHAFRFLFMYEDEKVVIEFNRKIIHWAHDDISLASFEQAPEESSIPRILMPGDHDFDAASTSVVFGDGFNFICLYPLALKKGGTLIISAASASLAAPIDSDYRFFRQLGNILCSKLLQILFTSRLEQLVAKRTQQLRSANGELSTLFYRVSHDLSAPLTTLTGLARLGILLKDDPSQLPEIFDRINSVIDASHQLFHKLKSIGEIDLLLREKNELHLTDFESYLMHKYCGINKGIKVTCSLRGKGRLFFNEKILKLLLDNLVENAFQYHKVSPYQFIRISIESTAEHLIVEVSDNGQGISGEYHSEIFKMCTRMNLASKGNGLGLYLVKRIVDSLSGTIYLESTDGIGSLFRLTIPV